MKPILAACFGALILWAQPALADGDALKGAIVFKKCMACHSATEANNKVGPHLVGLIGRAVASVPDFKYSEDMTAFATTAGIWDEAKLNSYLENPKSSVAKTKMAFAGLKKEDERMDLIAYLKSLQ
jgi:cytochrome c